MSNSSSYRLILKSSMIIGLGSILNILFGMIRIKVVAIYLGPAAVGMIGIYQNLMQTTSTVTSLGMESAGTRHIAAAAKKSLSDSFYARRAVSKGMLMLAIVTGISMLTFGKPLANLLLGASVSTWDVIWLSMGAACTVLSGAQFSQLSGMRRIADIARAQVASGLTATICSVSIIWTLKYDGIGPFVAILPAVSMLVGFYFTHKLNDRKLRNPSLAELVMEWRVLLMPGIAFMGSQIISLGGLLIIRSQIQHASGTEALGMFQASWSIGVVYLSIVINAMSADFYPRLSAYVDNHDQATRIINDQVEVAMLICGPLILCMLSISHFVIRILYSAEFDAAESIMRWQILGDIFKISAFPLGYLMLARKAGGTFLIAESVGIGTFVLSVKLLIPAYGLEAAGLAFLLSQLVYLPTVYLIAKNQIGFRWRIQILSYGLILFLSALIIVVLTQALQTAGALLGLTFTLISVIYSIERIASKAELGLVPAKLYQMIGMVLRMKESLKAIFTMNRK